MKVFPSEQWSSRSRRCHARDTLFREPIWPSQFIKEYLSGFLGNSIVHSQIGYSNLLLPEHRLLFSSIVPKYDKESQWPIPEKLNVTTVNSSHKDTMLSMMRHGLKGNFMRFFSSLPVCVWASCFTRRTFTPYRAWSPAASHVKAVFRGALKLKMRLVNETAARDWTPWGSLLSNAPLTSSSRQV